MSDSDSKSKKLDKGAKPKRLKLEVPKDVQTTYGNLVRIAHSPAELIFEFARILPGDTSAKVVSRVIMSPLGAKLLLHALNENLAKYESAFGEIKNPQKQSLADYLFKPSSPDEPSEE